MSDNKIIIAIDGYSSSGKSTMARSLAQRLGYRYIDSGAMYRAVTLFALRHNLSDKPDELIKSLPNIDIDFKLDGNGRQYTTLNGENVETEIRGMLVSDNVSQISTIPAIRHDMVRKQQAFGEEKGIVMDGRDIGTTVFPNAELKIFVNASPNTRAIRRLEELRQKGDVTTTFEEVLKNIENRDYNDSHRTESPLRCADDAVVLDNSSMTIEEQNLWIDNIVKDRLENL